MRRCLTFSITVLLSVTAVCAEDRNNSLLSELDKTIRNRVLYNDRKEDRLRLMKLQLNKPITGKETYDIYTQIFDCYKQFNNDSCLHYALKKREYAEKLHNRYYMADAAMNYVEFLMFAAMYKEAVDSLNSIKSSQLSEEQRPYYYHLCRTVYGCMAEHAIPSTEKAAYERLVDRYCDSLLMVHSPESITFLLIQTDRLIDRGDLRQALEILLARLNTLTPGSHEVGMFAYSIAEIYKKMGEKRHAVYYYALSSIADLKSGVKEYASLPRLAMLMLELGEVEKAYNYLKCSLEDAISGKQRIRAVEVSQIFPIVNDAYQLEVKRKHYTLYILLISVCVFFVVLLIALLFIYKQMKKVTAARKELVTVNTQLKKLNGELYESNTIKEEYIGRYMDLCTAYIGKMNEYRLSLLRLFLARKDKELHDKLKSTELLDQELKAFYAHFDETFLLLFPSFISDFNALLSEKITPKHKGMLTPELRIFALIRLGITDSKKIAQFLHYTPTTIFNYRTRVRNKAIDDRNDLERKVMHIGHSKK
jgi:hypothetical protein